MDKKSMEGYCPTCGSANISYSGVVPQDDQLYYEGECDDCGCLFREWYSVQFMEKEIIRKGGE